VTNPAGCRRPIRYPQLIRRRPPIRRRCRRRTCRPLPAGDPKTNPPPTTPPPATTTPPPPPRAAHAHREPTADDSASGSAAHDSGRPPPTTNPPPRTPPVTNPPRGNPPPDKGKARTNRRHRRIGQARLSQASGLPRVTPQARRASEEQACSLAGASGLWYCKGSVQQSLRQPAVGIDAPVAQDGHPRRTSSIRRRSHSTISNSS